MKGPVVHSRPFKHYFVLLATYLRPQWRATLLMSLLLLASIGLQITQPQFLRLFIDTIAEQGVTMSLLWLALAFLAIMLLNQGTSVVAAYLCERVAWTATNELRTDLLAHILTLDMQFHKSHTPGELLERVDGDVNVLTNFFSKFVVYMLFHIGLLLSMLVTLSWINPLLGGLMALYAVAIMAIIIYIRRPAKGLWVTADAARADFYGFLHEMLDGREDVQANGGMPYVWRHFHTRFQYWWNTTFKAGMAGGTPWIISRTLYAFGGLLGLILGAYLWSQGLANYGLVYLIYAYSTLLMHPLDQIQWQLQDLQQAEASISRINGLRALTSPLQDGTATVPTTAPTITFDDVSFGYSADEPVLKHVSFKLEDGHVLGLVGRTGSGKSTLGRLLFRMYDPQSGTILLDGVPLHTMPLHILRKRVALITQDVQLFNASVRDNLTFFDEEIGDEQLLAVLTQAGLRRWLQTLPEGLDTHIGPTGKGLSAGEAQMLAFARVFLHEPTLVILDEASSRLDPATEGILADAMRSLFKNRTGIIIAHRLQTLNYVDDVLLLSQGRVQEYGSRTALLSDDKSGFARFVAQDAGAIFV